MDFKRILAAMFLMMAVPCLVAEEASGTSGHLIQSFPSFSELSVGGALPFLGSLPPNAVELFKIGPLPVTNSMVVTWIVALGIIFVVQLATRNVKLVPDGTVT